MDTSTRLTGLAQAMETDLRSNILPFWTQSVPDQERGGFLGHIADDGTVDPEGPRGGVLNARILWTFSSAFQRYAEDAYRAMADAARVELVDRFWDDTHGGIYWMLDRAGNVVSDRKQTYALAFALYGLTEYYRATGSPAVLERALDLYRAIETHAADRDRVEAFPG